MKRTRRNDATPKPRRRRARAPAGTPAGFPFPCDDELVGGRVSGRDFAGRVLGCSTPPEGKRGSYLYVGGGVVSRGRVARAADEGAKARAQLAERWSGPDHEPTPGPSRSRGRKPPPPVATPTIRGLLPPPAPLQGPPEFPRGFAPPSNIVRGLLPAPRFGAGSPEPRRALGYGPGAPEPRRARLPIDLLRDQPLVAPLEARVDVRAMPAPNHRDKSLDVTIRARPVEALRFVVEAVFDVVSEELKAHPIYYSTIAHPSWSIDEPWVTVTNSLLVAVDTVASKRAAIAAVHRLKHALNVRLGLHKPLTVPSGRILLFTLPDDLPWSQLMNLETVLDDHRMRLERVQDRLVAGPFWSDGPELREVLAATPTGLPVTLEDLTEQYVFLLTGAPADYDGFGTVSVGTAPAPGGGQTRKVAVRREALVWQRTRYFSGGYGSEAADDRARAELAPPPPPPEPPPPPRVVGELDEVKVESQGGNSYVEVRFLQSHPEDQDLWVEVFRAAMARAADTLLKADRIDADYPPKIVNTYQTDYSRAWPRHLHVTVKMGPGSMDGVLFARELRKELNAELKSRRLGAFRGTQPPAVSSRTTKVTNARWYDLARGVKDSAPRFFHHVREREDSTGSHLDLRNYYHAGTITAYFPKVPSRHAVLIYSDPKTSDKRWEHELMLGGQPLDSAIATVIDALRAVRDALPPGNPDVIAELSEEIGHSLPRLNPRPRRRR